ncbi:MAG: CidA/LrgA family protein [Spirochaetales bacterium]|uniref:CidA/LrgA family protein n=1 Tax=Candidatus Thalassospirochaeta sargassi TaxID=3119039 RepID=A0AAJ1MKB3_9SPIO|nr:CidA/LrgA family protein [Spirochaetales bacterium]
MGILGEFLILAVVALSGSLMNLIPWFPLPGAVSGMLLMLILLLSGIIKLERVTNAAGFFLKFLPLFFIPFVINLMKESDVIAAYGVKLILVISVTTLLTMAATGLTAKLLLSLHSGKKDTDD